MELRFSPLFSGSSGNAIYVGCDDAHLLVDAGMSGTRVIQELQRMGVDPRKVHVGVCPPCTTREALGLDGVVTTNNGKSTCE